MISLRRISIGIGDNIEYNEKLPGFMLYGQELQIVTALDKFNYNGGKFTFVDTIEGSEMTVEFPESDFV